MYAAPSRASSYALKPNSKVNRTQFRPHQGPIQTPTRTDSDTNKNRFRHPQEPIQTPTRTDSDTNRILIQTTCSGVAAEAETLLNFVANHLTSRCVANTLLALRCQHVARLANELLS